MKPTLVALKDYVPTTPQNVVNQLIQPFMGQPNWMGLPASAFRPYSIGTPDGKIMRFEVRHGDPSTWDVQNGDPCDRAELSHYYSPIANEIPIQLNYKFMIEPGPTNTATWNCIGQFHENEQPTGPRCPPTLNIGLVSGTDLMTVDLCHGNAEQIRLFTDIEPLERGVWHEIDIRAKFSHVAGRIVVYRDGLILCDYSGVTQVDVYTGVYWKQGIYRHNNALEPMSIQYDIKKYTFDGSATFPGPNAFIPAPVFSLGPVGNDGLVNVVGTVKAHHAAHVYVNGVEIVPMVSTDYSGKFTMQVPLSLDSQTSKITMRASYPNQPTKLGVFAQYQTVLCITGQEFVDRLDELDKSPWITQIYLTDGTTIPSYFIGHYKPLVAKVLNATRMISSTKGIVGKTYDRQDTYFNMQWKAFEMLRYLGDKIVLHTVTDANGVSKQVPIP